MKTILRALVVASLALPLFTHAADKAADPAALSAATVKKIDVAANRVMLAHGPIANLNMHAMTMFFKVKDAALLGKIKEGDKILFRAEEDPKGGLVVVRIEAAKK
ncbi:MAG: copper-binding protein [Rhodocyclaceae bacterium]